MEARRCLSETTYMTLNSQTLSISFLMLARHSWSAVQLSRDSAL